LDRSDWRRIRWMCGACDGQDGKPGIGVRPRRRLLVSRVGWQQALLDAKRHAGVGGAALIKDGLYIVGAWCHRLADLRKAIRTIRRQTVVLGLPISVVALVACLQATALAAHFSTPVRLPTHEEQWKFAVDDNGDAVGVYASNTGAVVVQLAKSGRIIHSWVVGAPAQEESGGVSITLNDYGNIALGLIYNDDEMKPGGLHSGPGCCDRFAIASWHLGDQPPAYAESIELTRFDQPVGPSVPILVVGRSTITALWCRGNGLDSESGESRIEEAYGSIGGPLHSAKLLTARRGVTSIDLHEGTNGRPVASWVEDADIIRTVAGLSTGAIRSPKRFQVVPKLRGRIGHKGGVEVGFTHDDEGDTVFAYLLPAKSSQRLTMMTSRMAGSFGRPRTIASISPESWDVALYGGGHKSLFATWQNYRLDDRDEHFDALRGSVFGGFERKLRFDEMYSKAEFGFADPTGFQDFRGRSVMIHEAPAVNRPRHFEIYAVIAQAHRSFGHLRQIAPGLRDCPLNIGEESEVKPVASSSNGQAVFYLTCEEESGRKGNQYVIRYTP
jgi:hypothetical protein